MGCFAGRNEILSGFPSGARKVGDLEFDHVHKFAEVGSCDLEVLDRKLRHKCRILMLDNQVVV